MSLTASPEAGTLRKPVAPWHDRTHAFSAPIRRPLIPMPKRLVLSALTLFAAQTAGRNMTKAAYVAVTVGVSVMVLLTVVPAYEAAHLWVDAVLWACWAYFVFEWAVRLRHALM
jgi:hypothetical protein